MMRKEKIVDEKKGKEKKNKKQKGISLIALVVTIIVLIILAAVGIVATFGNNGLISRVKQAETEVIKKKWKQN